MVGAVVLTAGYAWSVFSTSPSSIVEWVHDIGAIVAPVIAAVLCMLASRRATGRERAIWGLLGGGAALWALGHLASVAVDRLGRPPSTLSFADVGHFALIATWAVAMLVHPLFRRTGMDLGASIVDALTLLTVGVTLVAEHVVDVVIDVGLPTVDATVLLARPIGDLVLLALFVFVFARSRLRAASAAVWLGATVVLLLSADSTYALLAASAGYERGSSIDLLWAAGFAALGCGAALHRPLTAPLIRDGESHAISILGSVAAAVLVLFSVIERSWVLGTGASVAAGLVVVRRVLFAMENRRLMRAVRDHARLSEQAAIAKEAFVAEASHQLRTPLTSIRVRLDVIKMSGLDDAMTPEYMEELSDEVDRLRRLAERLLTLASTDVVTPKQSRDLTKVAEEAVARLAQRARLAQVGLQTAALPDTAMVLAAPGALEEALMNLMDNALKYSPRGGMVRVGVSPGEGCYEIWVEDDGPGFDEQFADRLFEPFYRVASQKPGYGLGLAIVKRICDSEKAEVALQRRPEGGTRAWMRWPVQPAEKIRETEAVPTDV